MKTYRPHLVLLVVAQGFIYPASAQTTKNITMNISNTATLTGAIAGAGAGNGTVNPFGNAAVSLATTQGVDANLQPTGPIQASFGFSFNRLDSLNAVASIPDLTTASVATFPVTINGGTGAYNGASGSGTFTITVVDRGSNGANAQLTLSGTGSVTVGQNASTAISLANVNLVAGSFSLATISASGAGTISPLGNVTMAASVTTSDGNTGQGTAVFTFNPNDSFTVFFVIPNLNAFVSNFPATVTRGTGVYAGATGSINMTLAYTSSATFNLTGTGTITQPAQGTMSPVITSIKTAGSNAASISPNAWVQIQGTNLVPADTPAAGVIWNDAPEFASGRMPTQLGGISATVNGKPAYIYFFCSAATSSVCTVDQINILTPLDAAVGQIPVVVTNGTVSSAPFVVAMQAVSPSFLQWDLTGHPVATHTDSSFSLLGPTSLFPGFTTPAHKLEKILIYGDGFGLPTAAQVEGSSAQFGVLPDPQPACIFGTTPVAATAVLVSPGLYGFGLTVPDTAVTGDNPITCTYMNAATPAGDVISVQ